MLTLDAVPEQSWLGYYRCGEPPPLSKQTWQYSKKDLNLQAWWFRAKQVTSGLIEEAKQVCKVISEDVRAAGRTRASVSMRARERVSAGCRIASFTYIVLTL